MQQIRCGLCGRQTLVDPQSPGTCPSCGFPLSVPAELAAPAPVPGVASPAEPSAAAAPVVATEPLEAGTPTEPFTVGPMVADPAPFITAQAEASELERAPAGAALVIGPVVGDPAPAETAQLAAQPAAVVEAPLLDTTSAEESVAPVVAEMTPEAFAGDADYAADAEQSATAGAVEPPAVPVAAAAYVPPVPVPHTAWQDVSDAADSHITIPSPVADDIYAAHAPEPEPEPAGAVEAEEATAVEPGLVVQASRFDMSDAAIVAASEPEPSAVVEDIYVTRMADPAPEPDAMAAVSPIWEPPIWEAPTADAAIAEATIAEEPIAEAPSAKPAAEESVSIVEESGAAEATPAMVAPTPEPEQVTMAAAEVPVQAPPAEPVVPVGPAAAEMVAPAIADEAVTQVAAAPVEAAPAEQEHVAAAPSVPAQQPELAAHAQPPQQPAPYPGYASPDVPLPGQYPYMAQPPQSQQPPTVPYPYPYPANPSVPMGQMPPTSPMSPMSPMSQVPPPPKKSRVGLIVALIIAGVLVLALIIAAIVGLLLVRPATRSSSGAVAPATPTAAPVTPMPSIPDGFQPYTGTDSSFSLNVPSDWTQNTSSSGNSNVIDFTAPDNTGRLRVAVISGTVGDQGSSFEDVLFGVVMSNGKVSNKQGPSSVTQAGETWTQESADVSNDTGTLHVVAEVATHAGNTYTVLYLAAPDSFTTLQSQDFQPMFTSLQFLK